MKMSKQTGQVMILAVLMVALVIFGVYQFTAGNKAAPPPPPPPPASGEAANNPAEPAKAENAVKKGASAVVTWIELERVPKLVAQTKGGRDPFKDIVLYAGGKSTIGSANDPVVLSPQPEPTIGNGSGDDLEVHTITVTLDWITPQQVASAMNDAGLAVKLRAGKRANIVIIEGESPDYEEALALVAKLNVPPPAPPFQLTGVMLAPGSRYAAIGLEGNVYTVLEGEPVPTTDWTVTQISPTTVTLKKGKQSVSLRLAGGSPS